MGRPCHPQVYASTHQGNELFSVPCRNRPRLYPGGVLLEAFGVSEGGLGDAEVWFQMGPLPASNRRQVFVEMKIEYRPYLQVSNSLGLHLSSPFFTGLLTGSIPW